MCSRINNILSFRSLHPLLERADENGSFIFVEVPVRYWKQAGPLTESKMMESARNTSSLCSISRSRVPRSIVITMRRLSFF
ncbi:hypothetical protein AB1N83_007679 [Pleurotus pulmonarius]